jgi:hypothetical protein
MGGRDEVEVHLRFDGRWVGGFEVAEVHGTGPHREVWIRRRSDGAVLPTPFQGHEVRRVGPTGRRSRSRHRAG